MPRKKGNAVRTSFFVETALKSQLEIVCRDQAVTMASKLNDYLAEGLQRDSGPIDLELVTLRQRNRALERIEEKEKERERNKTLERMYGGQLP
jgi:hypothetical protein